MYEKHFGLKSRPFRSSIESPGLFVGPAQAKIMANLKKSLAASDAIVTVTGPVGVGKSTVVYRALEGIGNRRIIARVGRMKLAADEVLELLLTELNVSRQPNGTIQRFSVFKRLLHEWAEADTRAFIVVEDAERIGMDALLELEALTAADHGEGIGANIVLMGQPSLSELLNSPALARLRQRIRLQQLAGPFSAAETLGYLKHCIRNAGGEFDRIFEPEAADMLYRCSEGLPRVINNLSESVLVAAADANAPLVLPQLVQHIAREEFGLNPNLEATARHRTETISSDTVPVPAKHATAALSKHGDTMSAASGVESDQAHQVTPASHEFEPVPVFEFTATSDIRPLADFDTNSIPATKTVETRKPSKAAKPANAAKSVDIRKPAEATTRPGLAKPVDAYKSPQVKALPEPTKSVDATKPPQVNALPETAKPVDAIKSPQVNALPEPAKPVDANKSLQVKALPEPTKSVDATKPPQVNALPEPAELVDANKSPQAKSPSASNMPAAAKTSPESKSPADFAAPREEVADAAPELIQDTQPELTVLTVEDDLPDLTDLIVPMSQIVPRKAPAVTGSRPASTMPLEKSAKSARVPVLDDIPTLSGEMKIGKSVKPTASRASLSHPPIIASDIASPAAVTTAKDDPDSANVVDPKSDATITEIPAWDRDPTLAELRPDMEALEEALSTSSKGMAPKPPVSVPAKEVATTPTPPDAARSKAGSESRPFDLPEITLEKELIVKKGLAQDALRKGKTPGPEKADTETAVKRKQGMDLDRIVSELGKARSLEDVDDRLAETLFGDEMAAAAAEVAAMVAADAAANQELMGEPEPVLKLEPEPAMPEATIPPPKPALPAVKPVTPTAPAAGTRTARNSGATFKVPEPAPIPIEDQFGTSMTASLEALSASQIRKMDESAFAEEDDDDDEPEEEVKAPRRLFGLFRGNR